MKRSVENVRNLSSTGVVAPKSPRTTSAGIVTRFHGYRRRVRMLRTLKAARSALGGVFYRLRALPGPFWTGLLAGLVVGALFLVVTGHGGLFLVPLRHGSGTIPAPFKKPG
jgi:hypothetical protein